eukprot:TRINITY_DN999_c0_g1_i1.p1 TRINITY_DN999_c0_g1~~TRINITY_DN999_c0_g1_i1.p1  ORF type:complete len:162 (-),score=31.96 TRINITY_DN999_c0_g1_i1:33-473(-)
MSISLANPAFRYYALSVVALSVKQIFTHCYTGVVKLRTGQVTPEDAIFKPNPKKDNTHPDVERALAVTRNDHENIYLFYVIAFLYVLTGASATAAQILFPVFVVSRYLHTYFYQFLKAQPWRAFAFIAGLAVNIFMIVSIILSLQK